MLRTIVTKNIRRTGNYSFFYCKNNSKNTSVDDDLSKLLKKENAARARQPMPSKQDNKAKQEAVEKSLEKANESHKNGSIYG